MRITLTTFGVLVALASTPVIAQQSVDARYAPKIAHLAYAANGPVVAIDQAHRNFHTMDGEYAPFARLLAADGYRVQPSTTLFSDEGLKGVGILVIANARSTDDAKSAFSDAEIAAVKAWVEAGGSLFLISDHAPFGGAAAALSQAFGVDMGRGYAVTRESGRITSQIEFSGADLGEHPILHGRDENERAKHVRSFTGQSLSIPPSGAALLILPRDAFEVVGPQQVAALRQGQSVSSRHVGGRAQCVALSDGQGRVIIAGEAAMFSAQIVRLPDGSVEHVGLTVEDDQRFTLNVMHWLSRILP